VGARVGFVSGRELEPLEFGAGLGYLKLFGAKQRGAALRLELAYWRRRYGEYRRTGYTTAADLLIRRDEVVPAHYTDNLVLAAGFSFYFRSKRSADAP
jgi:hypothetical protein